MYLRVVGESLQPEQISARLGTGPDEATEIGSRRRPQSPPRTHATWIRHVPAATGPGRPEDLEPVILGGSGIRRGPRAAGRLRGRRRLPGRRPGAHRPGGPAAEGHLPERGSHGLARRGRGFAGHRPVRVLRLRRPAG
ncbi:DUF4279 domain-containing protein [Streptomyces bungoensis]